MHHLIPRSKGGPTRLDNLTLLCHFHHLVVIHRWGWSLTLHADGTTTAKSPDGIRTLHSHGPPPGQDTLWTTGRARRPGPDRGGVKPESAREKHHTPCIPCIRRTAPQLRQTVHV